MDYRIIREARLRVPFRAFTLTFHDGGSVFITEPTLVAIASNALIVPNNRGVGELRHPRDVVSLTYADEISGKAN
jgi:hypothetical protein